MTNEPMLINDFLARLAQAAGLSESQMFGIHVIAEICNNLR